MKTIQVNGQTMPLGNIFCIGRNYTEHIKELNNALPTEPVVFMKPTSALAQTGEAIVLPSFSESVHHECELVVYIKADVDHVSPEDALRYVGGYAIGLDLTARDVQSVCKEKGLPWTKAKGFRTAACLSHFIAPDVVGDIQEQQFSLLINGEIRQQGNSVDMMFPVGQIIAYLSTIYGLQAGDVIYTGTPAGVGPLQVGDIVRLDWHGHIQAEFHVV